VADDRIFRGWDIVGSARRGLKRAITDIGKTREGRDIEELGRGILERLGESGLDDETGIENLSTDLADHVLTGITGQSDDLIDLPLHPVLTRFFQSLLAEERLFDIPDPILSGEAPLRSQIWEAEDQLRRTKKVLDHFDVAMGDLCRLAATAIAPLVEQHPELILPRHDDETDGDLRFGAHVLNDLDDLPGIVEAMILLPFAPELNEYATMTRLRARLEYNLARASGAAPGEAASAGRARLPTKAGPMKPSDLVATYLEGTPFPALFDCATAILLPQETRFEHHHIVAGSGHGKTQTLQHLILHDLQAVAAGRASIVVIDSQRDLIDNIAGLKLFAPGEPLADRLCLIDPSDVEWPVALNLFDVGMERINRYSALDRERLINGVLELYDFVLGSLLDAGMTQKQTVIFRYITRLLIHIPGATIHTFRQLLEDDGVTRFASNIAKLSGSARAFFENEFAGKEFASTRRQVLRRLYGILENQTFERMFSHPKSKLDLFAEMNAGKVILINTAKDLLKANGTEIFGRFFIAMIAQAAQERAVLAKEERLPTFVHVDEANDYFDRNIGIILSQARKYRIGMVLAHQFLGQLEPKLAEAIFANTSIRFAGGVSAKDARTLAPDMRTDSDFIERQERLSFAAFVRGATRKAVSISVEPGAMERLPRMSEAERSAQRDRMRAIYAVHVDEIGRADQTAITGEPENDAENPVPEADTGEPMPWN